MENSSKKYDLPYVVFIKPSPPRDVEYYPFNGIPQVPGLPLAVQRDYFESGTDSGYHLHCDFYALFIVRSGRGLSIINDYPYGVTRGDVYIMPPGEMHCFRDYQKIELDTFYFQAQLFSRDELAALRKLKGFWRLFRPEKAKGDGTNYHLHLSPEQHKQTNDQISSIRAELSEASPLGNLMARHQFFCLLVNLARWHGEASNNPAVPELASNYATDIAEIVQYCEENFTRPITVPQLAARLFLSTDYFSRLFTAEMGVPPAAYLRRLRMERAQTLLRTTSLSIAEIANQVGVSDPNHFSRLFSATFDISPTAYRAKFRK